MINNSEALICFNVCLIGDASVGKTSLLTQFCDGSFHFRTQSTIGVDYRVVSMPEQKTNLQIWDTAGQENFRSITRSYYRSSVAAIVVYDITSRKSFEKISSWLQELRENAHNKIAIFLVGNKLDLAKQREVTYEEGYALSKAQKVKFTETCAFELNTIEPMFKSLAEDILAKIEAKEIDPSNEHYGVKFGNNKPMKLDSKHTEEVDFGGNKGERKPCCGS